MRNRLGGEVFLDTPDTVRTGRPWLSADAGLFFSQGTVDMPLTRRSSLRLSGRASYLNALYGNYLKIGGEDLSYGFGDVNLTWNFRKDKYRIRKTDVYFGSDKAAIDAQGYGIPLSFGWRNMALSQRFINTRFGEQALYFSQYDATVNPGDGGGFHPVDHLLRTIGYRAQVNAFRSERGRAVLGFEGAFHQLRGRQMGLRSVFRAGDECPEADCAASRKPPTATCGDTHSDSQGTGGEFPPSAVFPDRDRKSQQSPPD